jgi:catechol 2,3-dioxygenase-like lactoylglutathione lyase family enzyme
LPITRLAGATFQVKDLEQARKYYGGMLGYTDVSKVPTKSIYRLNADQYLEFQGGAPENFRLLYVTMLTPNPEKLPTVLAQRGVRSTKGKGYVAIKDPENNEIRFVRSLGAKEVPPGGFSDHLLHVGLNSDHESESLELYKGALGFDEMQRGGPSPSEIRWVILNMPKTPGDWVEVMVAKEQPPAMRQHICFEVADTQSTHKLLVSRGMPERFKPFPAQNHRMILNLRDPNGLRVEIMGETTK